MSSAVDGPLANDTVIDKLRNFYDRDAHERQDRPQPEWKMAEREAFSALLPPSAKLLELGSGPGRDASWFSSERGCAVTCIDLSPAMVQCCVSAGLTSKVHDFSRGELPFDDAAFDAVFSMNSLLHVRKAHLPAVLRSVRRVLRPSGLFFLGVHGGVSFEGEWDDDPSGERRFFSYMTDVELRAAVSDVFEVVRFQALESGRAPGLHFQSFTLRKGSMQPSPPAPTPPHGRLSVRDGQLCGADGRPAVLAGVSFFWSQWMGHLYTAECTRFLADDFGAILVRAALGVHESSGFLHAPATERDKVYRVVDAAIAHGLYVIIDWHDHTAHLHTQEAAAFFRDAAQRYAGCPNVIYEIWNEPLEVSWSTIKSYAECVIAAIRQHDSEGVIICGTPRWSQRVDEVMEAPAGAHNVAYALHFYAGTHRAELRAVAARALAKGLCLFVSEWGAVNADGDGAVDHASVGEWMAFIHEHKLSHAAWAVSDKVEGAAFLKPDAPTCASMWTTEHLTESGRTIRAILRTCRGWNAD